MSYWPIVAPVPFPVISTADMALGLSTISAVAWPTANKAFYFGISLPQPVIATKVWWLNGATVGTDSVDVGVYSADGTRIISGGGTVTSGASTTQMVDITDTMIPAGAIYLAMSMNGTTDTTFRAQGPTTVFQHKFLPVYHQTTAYVLPATALPLPQNSCVTMIGASRVKGT